MRKFRDLKVWQKAHELTIIVYRLVQHLPKEERFGLASQLKRAVISIEANIAEGSRRRTDKDYAHFIGIADGSAAEVSCLLQLTVDLGFLRLLEDEVRTTVSKTEEISKMLYGFQTTLLGANS